MGLETGSYHAATHSVRSGRPDALPTELSWLGALLKFNYNKNADSGNGVFCICVYVTIDAMSNSEVEVDSNVDVKYEQSITPVTGFIYCKMKMACQAHHPQALHSKIGLCCRRRGTSVGTLEVRRTPPGATLRIQPSAGKSVIFHSVVSS